MIHGLLCRMVWWSSSCDNVNRRVALFVEVSAWVTGGVAGSTVGSTATSRIQMASRLKGLVRADRVCDTHAVSSNTRSDAGEMSEILFLGDVLGVRKRLWPCPALRSRLR